MKSILAVSTLALAAIAGPGFANNKVVVYIECTHDSKPVSQGTGVIVSAKGHIMTARHVVPEGYACKGAVENRTNPMRGLIRPVQDRNLDQDIDGKLLRFIPNEGEEFAFAPFCPIEPELGAVELIAKGFHRDSIAFPSATSGVLSTHIQNDVGIVETDAMTISGKSGGPVFIKGTNAIIGVVAGASFEPTGLPAYYGVLAADAVAFSFRVMTETQSCIPAALPTVTSEAENTPAANIAATAVVASPAADKERASYFYYQALDFLDAGELEKAIDHYDRAIEHDPHNALYWNDRGYSYLLTDQLDKAKADFDQAIALDPNMPDIYANRGEYFEIINDWDSAIKDYDILVSKSPNDAEAYYWRAMAYKTVGSFTQSLADFDKAISIDIRTPNAHAFRGVVYSQLGENEKALADYDTALGLDPRNEDIFTDRGLTLLEMGHYEQALSDFDFALEINASLQRAIDGRQDVCGFLATC